MARLQQGVVNNCSTTSLKSELGVFLGGSMDDAQVRQRYGRAMTSGRSDGGPVDDILPRSLP